MAKRFITTGIFEDAWFMDLPAKYKLFWIYLITRCDHAGIWEVNNKQANFYVGEHLESVECERILKDRIVKIEGGKYWFIPKFIEFQYGTTLNTSNKALLKVIGSIDKYNLMSYLPLITIERPYKEGSTKGLASPLQGHKEKDKDRDKEEVKEEDNQETPRLLWINIYNYNPGMVEIDFSKQLVEKFGYEKAKRILYELRENGFHKIATMRNAIDYNGDIKPKQPNENAAIPAAHQLL